MIVMGILFAAASLCSPFLQPPSLAICRRAEGSVAEVRDGETLALIDGTLVRLINAKAPAAPLAARSDRPWPFAAELASGAEIELRYGGAKADRHGRALAQVYVVKGGERLWLQGELVGKGLARVYSFPRRLGRLTRSYQLVEGAVAEVGELGGRLYLNFDKDWRKDFTILMERKDGEAFKAAGIDPKALAGKKLRVRGWVEWRNGPMIHATHAEQIELLPDGGGPSAPSPSPPSPPQDREQAPTGAIEL